MPHYIQCEQQKLEFIQKFQNTKSHYERMEVLRDAGFQEWQLALMEAYRKAAARQANKTFSRNKGFPGHKIPYSVIATDRNELVLYFSSKGAGLLGQGKSGKVVRAVVIASGNSERIGLQVAVKKMVTEPGIEAKILANRGELHTNEVYTRISRKNDKVTHILIQDFIKGEPLSKRLASTWEKMGTTDEKVALACSIMKDLESLHADGVIHRDLWAENILIDKSRAKIIDYGRSALLRPGQKSVIEKIGEHQTSYCSPEALKDEWSAASDVYAMALVFFQLFASELQAWRNIDGSKQAYARFLDTFDASERMHILQDCLCPHLDSKGKAIVRMLVGMLQPDQKPRSSVKRVLEQLDKI